MKALVYRGGADPAHALEMEHIAEPVLGRKQILIDAQYSTAGTTDWIRFSDEEGRTPSLGKPLRMLRVGVGKPLGGEVSGTVRSVGEEVAGFAPGDAVYAATPLASGAWAQLCVADADDCAHVPDHLGMREAACLAVGPVVALAALRAADVRRALAFWCGARPAAWGARVSSLRVTSGRTSWDRAEALMKKRCLRQAHPEPLTAIPSCRPT